MLVWSLSTAYFPKETPGLSLQTYWLMSFAAAILLFVSVLLHELSHSLVAKAKKIKVKTITLFFFGGVAGIESEDMKPSTELQMALAGPLFSFLLAVIFYSIYLLNGSVVITAITAYLYQLNFILALFNLIPGYPLDGGRALRAVLHAYYKDLKKATRIASLGGKVVAGALVISGIIFFLQGGLWFIVLGGFLYFLAGASYEQVLIKDVLSKIPVKELLMTKFVTLNPEMKFADFVRKFISSEQEVFLVKDKKYAGLLDLSRVKKMSPAFQQNLKLKQASIPLERMETITPGENAYQAFRKLSDQNLEALPVLAGSRFLGLVAKSSILRRLMWELKYGQS